MFAAHGMGAPGDVRSADHEGRSMTGTVAFRGVPNQSESASRSASAAVSVGSSMVAAQAMWASGRIRRASAGRRSVSAVWMSMRCSQSLVGVQGEVGCEGAGQGVVVGAGWRVADVGAGDEGSDAAQGLLVDEQFLEELPECFGGWVVSAPQRDLGS